jgi:hypothetical protein
VENEVKNLRGQVIGRIETKEDSLCAYDTQGNMVGSYNPKTNTTYSKDGKSLGYGNQLAALLYK